MAATLEETACRVCGGSQNVARYFARGARWWEHDSDRSVPLCIGDAIRCMIDGRVGKSPRNVERLRREARADRSGPPEAENGVYLGALAQALEGSLEAAARAESVAAVQALLRRRLRRIRAEFGPIADAPDPDRELAELWVPDGIFGARRPSPELDALDAAFADHDLALMALDYP
jgi:hypothetical protein